MRVVRPPPNAAAGPPWWEIEFVPLTDETGIVAIVGKITAGKPVSAETPSTRPETWEAVRVQAADHFRLDSLDDRQAMLAAQARLAAANRCPIYLVGERGTGKRWLARAIHLASDVCQHSFVALDCAHLPVKAVRDVLFGPHGLDRPAWLGTVYLIEPAALPREVQAELTERLAGDDDTGPRIIGGSADADDPKRPVFLGRMLPELFDALAVLIVPLPPLRARKDDLNRLVAEMLNRAGPTFGKAVTGLTADAWECLPSHHWPGNLRELYAALVAAGQRAKHQQIDRTDLPLAVQQAKAASEAPAAKIPPRPPPLDTVLEEVERRMIRLALEKTGGNQSKAAEMLAVWRPRLIRRIAALGLENTRRAGGVSPLVLLSTNQGADAPRSPCRKSFHINQILGVRALELILASFAAVLGQLLPELVTDGPHLPRRHIERYIAFGHERQ